MRTFAAQLTSYLCKTKPGWNVQSRNFSSFNGKDERRMKIVELGGAQGLLNMLGAAKDDRTRKEALKALAVLSHSDEAVKALHHAGAVSIIRCTPDSLEDAEVEKYKSSMLKRFRDLRYDVSS